MQKDGIGSGLRPMAAAVAALLGAVFLLPLAVGEGAMRRPPGTA